jgi:hypothetical protein
MRQKGNFRMQPNNSTYAYTAPYPPEKNNYFSAGFDEPLDEHISKDRKTEWSKANAYNKFCRQSYEPRAAAHKYFNLYPDFPTDKFYTTGNKRRAAAKAALKPSGWGARLLLQLGYPNTPAYLYSLHMGHLGLDPTIYANPEHMYFEFVTDGIKAAIADRVPRPYYFKIECGRLAGVHVHLIAKAAPSLEYLIFDGSEVIKPLWSGREQGLFEYLAKPVGAWSVLNYETYLAAKAATAPRNVPRLAGQPGLKRQT